MTFSEVRVERDEGSVVMFSGVDEETGQRRSFVVDHRYAQAIVDAMSDGEPLELELEPYQLLG